VSPSPLSGRVLLLGIGNPFRHDDGVGPALVARLAPRLPPGVAARVVAGEATEILAALAGAARVLVVDAALADAAPGTLQRFAIGAGPAPPLPPPAVSGHGLGLAAAIALARALGRLPGELVVLAVAGEDFSPGEGLSPALSRRLPRLAKSVLAELARLAPDQVGTAGDPAS